MNRIQGCLFFAALALFASTGADGASFDCSGQLSRVERTICRDILLSDLDDNLSVVFLEAKWNPKLAGQAVREQRQWLRRRDACASRHCIESSYRKRIADLRSALDRLEMQWRRAQSASLTGVCALVAAATNEGRIQDLALKGRRDDGTFPMPPGLLDVEFLGHLDIDGDGRLEYVYLHRVPSARIETIVIYDDRFRARDTRWMGFEGWYPENLHSGTQIRVVIHEGSYYVVGMAADRLRYVGRFEEGNVFAAMCAFDQAPDPGERVVLSNDRALCDAATAGDLEPAGFDTPHVMTIEQVRSAGIPMEGPRTESAAVDIDNDGQVDYVIPVRLASLDGKDCQSTSLALLNDSLTDLAISPTATLLRQTVRECNGIGLHPVLHKGQTYLEERYEGGYDVAVRSIFKIEKGKRTETCRLETHKVNIPRLP